MKFTFKQIKAVFIHIPKTAGTFVNYVLRSLYGLDHVDLLAYEYDITDDEVPSWGTALHYDDIMLSCKLNPSVKSIAGHYLMPTPEVYCRLPNASWYSIMREPVERLISDYRHKCQLKGRIVSFENWIDKRTNLQIKMLVGSENSNQCIKAVKDGKLVVIELSNLNLHLQKLFCFDEKLVAWLQNQRRLNVRFGHAISDNEIMDNLARYNVRSYVEEEEYFLTWLRGEGMEIFNSIEDGLLQDRVWPQNHTRLTINRFVNRIYRNVLYKPFYRALRRKKR